MYLTVAGASLLAFLGLALAKDLKMSELSRLRVDGFEDLTLVGPDVVLSAGDEAWLFS